MREASFGRRDSLSIFGPRNRWGVSFLDLHKSRYHEKPGARKESHLGQRSMLRARIRGVVNR